MADIHIVRAHKLGLEQARKLAFRWAEVAEQKLDMECTYEEGTAHDVVHFKRPGAHGTLNVTRERFTLDAKLGLLLGVFKGRIESAIVENLDELLAHRDPLHAFEQGLAKHEGRHEPKHEARHAAKHAKPHAEPHKPAKATAKAPRKKP